MNKIVVRVFKTPQSLWDALGKSPGLRIRKVTLDEKDKTLEVEATTKR